MSTYSSLHYHLVFSTKNRLPWLKLNWGPELHRYMGGAVRGLGGVPQGINGVEDHVHLLIGLLPTHQISDFVRELKKSCNAWIRQEYGLNSFAWQQGYAIFTVGAADRAKVQTYIHDQVHHHHTQGYIDELKRMLERAEIDYDPKYLE